jgi:hypothetical protein
MLFVKRERSARADATSNPFGPFANDPSVPATEGPSVSPPQTRLATLETHPTEAGGGSDGSTVATEQATEDMTETGLLAHAWLQEAVGFSSEAGLASPRFKALFRRCLGGFIRQLLRQQVAVLAREALYTRLMRLLRFVVWPAEDPASGIANTPASDDLAPDGVSEAALTTAVDTVMYGAAGGGGVGVLLAVFTFIFLFLFLFTVCVCVFVDVPWFVACFLSTNTMCVGSDAFPAALVALSGRARVAAAVRRVLRSFASPLINRDLLFHLLDGTAALLAPELVRLVPSFCFCVFCMVFL